MRVIDADALKKQIEDFHCKGCDNYNFVRCRACWVDDTLSYLDEAPTVGGWISVKDALPQDEMVVVIVKHKIGWYWVPAWHDEFGWHSSAREFKDGESKYVTHWMPLPEPPEEVTVDE